jgi:hypothetical protein
MTYQPQKKASTQSQILEHSLGPPGSPVDHDAQVDVAFTRDGERAHQVQVRMGEFPPVYQDGLRAGVGMLVDFCPFTVLATPHPFSNVCSHPRPDKMRFTLPPLHAQSHVSVGEQNISSSQE